MSKISFKFKVQVLKFYSLRAGMQPLSTIVLSSPHNVFTDSGWQLSPYKLVHTVTERSSSRHAKRINAVGCISSGWLLSITVGRRLILTHGWVSIEMMHVSMGSCREPTALLTLSKWLTYSFRKVTVISHFFYDLYQTILAIFWK